MGSVFICMKRIFFLILMLDGLFCDPQHLGYFLKWLDFLFLLLLRNCMLNLSFLKSKLYFFGILYSHSNYLLYHLFPCCGAPTTQDYNLNDEILIWLMVSETLVHSSLCRGFWTHGEEEQCHAGKMYGGVVSLMVDQKPKEWVEISPHRTFQGTTPQWPLSVSHFPPLKVFKTYQNSASSLEPGSQCIQFFGGSFTFES